jgi:NhaA family Na+:H+ antiporter
MRVGRSYAEHSAVARGLHIARGTAGLRREHEPVVGAQAAHVRHHPQRRADEIKPRTECLPYFSGLRRSTLPQNVSATDPNDPRDPDAPPGSWMPARRAARLVIGPIERFLAIEAAGGVVLLLAALVALLWANSPLRASYAALWHVPLAVQLGSFAFERDLHFWINDGLMTIFFFVVGLEIRREMHGGELSNLRRAALPLVAALGGMLVPAAIFALQNQGRASASGWGVPMATDIAFAVGVLGLLGKRVRPALRVLLLALAVIDDIGAIIVIAVFYSSSFALVGLGVFAAGVVIIYALQKLGVASPVAYVPAALLAWAGVYAAGIHPTLAGVVIGLLTPVTAWYGDESPRERMEHAFHGVVAYGIMPLFALANAGVALGNSELSGDGLWTFLGILSGLVLGKPLGIVGFAWLATRLGFASLPRGVQIAQLWVVGMVGGIGFTMAIFIADMAFPAGALLETAKLAVLCASGAAAMLGLLLGWKLLHAGAADADDARSESEAEASSAL